MGAVLGLATLTVGQSAAMADWFVTPGSEFDLPNPITNVVVTDWESYLDAEANLYGWASDAFDGFGGVILNDGAEDWTLETPTLASNVTDANGTTTIVFYDVASFRSGSEFSVAATLTLQGGFAKWTVDVAPVIPGDTVDIRIGGLVGSEGDSVFDIDGATMVSDDSGITDSVLMYDPLIVWGASQSGGVLGEWMAMDGSPEVAILGEGSTNLTVITAMVDFDPCSFDAAHAYAESIKTSLVDLFGSELAPFFSCLAVEPLTLDVGVPTAATLTYSLPEFITDPDGDIRYFGYNAPVFNIEPIAVDVQGLPAGVTYSQSQDVATGVVTVQLGGTPTDSGSFTPRVTFAQFRTTAGPYPMGLTGFDPALADWYEYPLSAPVELTVTPSLAKTGVDGAQNLMLLGFGGGVVLLGLAAVIVVTVRRRNAAKLDG
jgi:LPXTG-motif cell wall-anchored protein